MDYVHSVGLFFNNKKMEQESIRLEQERSELNALINKGVTFEVADVAFDVHRTWYGRKRYTRKEIKRSFTIGEPTLGTLDRLSAEWIEFAIDEQAMKSEDAMERARTLVAKHAERCARIIAIACLGSSHLIATPVGNSATRYTEDTGKIAELTALFMRTIKPSEMYQIIVLINAMCNLGDFTNSIRLMLADRTTMPIRIEESKKG